MTKGHFLQKEVWMVPLNESDDFTASACSNSSKSNAVLYLVVGSPRILSLSLIRIRLIEH